MADATGYELTEAAEEVLRLLKECRLAREGFAAQRGKALELVEEVKRLRAHVKDQEHALTEAALELSRETGAGLKLEQAHAEIAKLKAKLRGFQAIKKASKKGGRNGR